MTDAPDRAPESYGLPRSWSGLRGEGAAAPKPPSPREEADTEANETAPAVASPAPGAARIGRDSLRAGRDNNTFNFVEPPENFDQILRDLNGQRRYATDAESIERELALVVPPPQLEEHLGVLKEHGILVLCGEPRSGLSTAAKHRAVEFVRRRPMEIARVFADSVRDLERSVDDLEKPTLMLLDASVDRDLGRELVRRLPQIQASVQSQRSHLIIALGHEHFDPAAESVTGTAFRLRRPSGEAVLTRYLQGSDGATYLRPVLGHQGFRDELAKSWPPRIARLAEIIGSAGPGLSMGHLHERVRDGLSDWHRDLNERLGQRLDAASRALLMAAAVLETAPKESIVNAAKRFLELVEYEEEHRHLLNQPSLTAEFGQLTDVFDPSASVFRNPGYAEAVVSHVWKEYPNWRDHLKSWFLELLRFPKYLDDRSPGRAIVSFVSLASAVRDPGLITDSVSRHLAKDIGLGSQLLLQAALDANIGREIRRHLWDTAYAANVPVHKQLMVANVCGDPAYAERFPRNALYRLQHLAKCDDERVRQAILIGVSNVSLHYRPRILLIRFTDWLDPAGSSRLRELVPRMVKSVYGRDEYRLRLRRDPDALNTDPSGHVATFWQRLFTTTDPAAVRVAATTWLEAAADLDFDIGDAMADHLVSAAARDFRSTGQLAQTARVLLTRRPEGRLADLSTRIMINLLEYKEPTP